jgi:hypothetical protein
MHPRPGHKVFATSPTRKKLYALARVIPGVGRKDNMNATNIKWNRSGFDTAIGASVRSIGVYEQSIVTYTITDGDNVSAELSVGPYSKKVHLEIHQLGKLRTYVDLYDVQEIKYTKHDDGNGEIIYQIAIGPGRLSKNGNDEFYVFVCVKPTIGIWICERNEYEKTINDFPFDVVH